MLQLETLGLADDDDMPVGATARGRRGTRLLSVRDLFVRFPRHKRIPHTARSRTIFGVTFWSFGIVIDASGATRRVHVLAPTLEEVTFALELAQYSVSPMSPQFVACGVARRAFFEASTKLDPDGATRRLRGAEAYLGRAAGAPEDPPTDDKRLRRSLVAVLNHAARYYLRPPQLAAASAVERRQRRLFARVHVAQKIREEFPLAERHPSDKDIESALDMASRSLTKEQGASIYEAAARLARCMGAAKVDGETLRKDEKLPGFTKWDRLVGLRISRAEIRGLDTPDGSGTAALGSRHASPKKQQRPSPRKKSSATPRTRRRKRG